MDNHTTRSSQQMIGSSKGLKSSPNTMREGIEVKETSVKNAQGRKRGKGTDECMGGELSLWYFEYKIHNLCIHRKQPGRESLR